MIESLFGSLLKERLLVYLIINPGSYPNEMARNFGVSLYSVQRHLEKLERDNIVCSRLRGKTRLYEINPRSPFRRELSALLEKIFSYLAQEEKEKYYIKRTRPRM